MMGRQDPDQRQLFYEFGLSPCHAAQRPLGDRSNERDAR